MLNTIARRGELLALHPQIASVWSSSSPGPVECLTTVVGETAAANSSNSVVVSTKVGGSESLHLHSVGLKLLALAWKLPFLIIRRQLPVADVRMAVDRELDPQSGELTH